MFFHVGVIKFHIDIIIYYKVFVSKYMFVHVGGIGFHVSIILYNQVFTKKCYFLATKS